MGYEGRYGAGGETGCRGRALAVVQQHGQQQGVVVLHNPVQQQLAMPAPHSCLWANSAMHGFTLAEIL